MDAFVHFCCLLDIYDPAFAYGEKYQPTGVYYDILASRWRSSYVVHHDIQLLDGLVFGRFCIGFTAFSSQTVLWKAEKEKCLTDLLQDW